MIERAIMSLKNNIKYVDQKKYMSGDTKIHKTQKLFRNLTYIINKCLNGYPVPEKWKVVVYISSIHKKGNRQECNITIGEYQ